MTNEELTDEEWEDQLQKHYEREQRELQEKYNRLTVYIEAAGGRVVPGKDYDTQIIIINSMQEEDVDETGEQVAGIITCPDKVKASCLREYLYLKSRLARYGHTTIAEMMEKQQAKLDIVSGQMVCLPPF